MKIKLRSCAQCNGNMALTLILNNATYCKIVQSQTILVRGFGRRTHWQGQSQRPYPQGKRLGGVFDQ